MIVSLFRPALLLAALTLPGASPAHAEDTRLRAKLAAPLSQPRFVAHNLLWRCVGDRCTAANGHSRPVIICQALAKMAGPVSSFGNGATKLDTLQLARCNGAAAPRMAAK